MLDAAKWEMDHNKEDPQLFDIFGRESKFVSPTKIKEYNSYEELVLDTLGAEYLDPSLAPSHPVPYRSITLIDNLGKKRTIDNRKFKIKGVEFTSPQRIFQQRGEKWVELRRADNCFTWAKEKLKMCGIFLDNNTLNAVISTPKTYLALGSAIQDRFSIQTKRLKSRSKDKQEKNRVLTDLLSAIKDGDADKVQTLIEEGADLTATNQKGLNPLHLACKKGAIKIVQLLYQKKMDLHQPAQDSLRSTPLFWAIIYHHESLVSFLINSGVKIDHKDATTGHTILHLLAKFPSIDPRGYLIPEEALTQDNLNTKNNKGQTPLILAVENQNTLMIRQLLQHKASVFHQDYHGCTAFWYAYKNNDTKAAKLLIENGADVNSFFQTFKQDEIWSYLSNHLSQTYRPHLSPPNSQMKYTPLEAAVRDKKLKMAHLFLEKGANANQKIETGSILLDLFTQNKLTLLGLAYNNEDEEMINLLNKYGADFKDFIKAKTKDISLRSAVKNKQKGIAYLTIKKGADINEKDSDGFTPLCYAYTNEDDEMVRLLRENGASVEAVLHATSLHFAVKKKNWGVIRLFLQERRTTVNEKNTGGCTPLWYAYQNEDEEMASFLLNQGANLSIVFNEVLERTPLQTAVRDKKIKMARLFLQKGAPVNDEDCLNKTVLWDAYNNGDIEMMDLLIQHGANVNRADEEKGHTSGRTLLQAAVRNNNLEIAKLLLKKGALVDQKDKQGNTAFSYACQDENEKAVHLLIKHGTNLSEALEIAKLNQKKNIIKIIKKALAEQIARNIFFLQEMDNQTVFEVISRTNSLMKAIQNGNTSKVRTLLDQEIDLRLKSLEGYNPLHLACICGDLRIVKILLKRGLNINEPALDFSQSTPLLLAIKGNHQYLAEFLIKSGADLNQRDSTTGDTVLHSCLFSFYPFTRNPCRTWNEY